MMKVGITGGIGSGKSVACNIFRQLGIPVYDADAEAKMLYGSVPEIGEKIKKEISEEVFDKKGKIDKQKLAAVVFQNESALKKLNKIIHPYVNRQFEEWAQQQTAAYVLKEAAILFESGSDVGCDKVIVVTAPEDLRIQRTMQRDKRTRSEVEQIMTKQWNDEEKTNRADFVIVNDERQMLIPQVLEIHSKLITPAK